MRDTIFQAWQHERNLLTSRLMIFLIVNSILFLGYVQIKDLCFGTIIAFMGLISCLLGGTHFKGLSARLGRLENQLDEKLKAKLGSAKGRIKGRTMVLFTLSLFALIWFFSILHSFGVIN